MDDLLEPMRNPSIISKNIGTTKTLVDYEFLTNSAASTYICIVCGQDAIFKLMPKSGVYDSAELENRGFICQHCIQSGAIDPKIYDLRHVSKLDKW